MSRIVQDDLIGNGNVLLGHSIPDEVLLNVFENLPDRFLVRVISRVCKHWHDLCETWSLWKKRLAVHGVSLSPRRLEKFSHSWPDDPRVRTLVKWLCTGGYRAFNHNLIKNPSGQERMKHWRVQDGGHGLIVEEPPIGCDPIPEEARLPSQHCFVSSYVSCKRTQTLNLFKDFGVRPVILDLLRPSLAISEWVSARFDCGAQSTIQVDARGAKQNDVAIFILQWNDADYGRVEWHKVTKVVPFEELPVGMATLRFKSVSKDTQFWAGNYGAKTAGSSLVLDISSDSTPQSKRSRTPSPQ